MANYVVLFSWTEQGAKTVKSLGQRIQNAEKLAQRLGGKVKDVYMTMGRYDVVAIVEAPDDETASRISLAVSMQGNSRSETLRAYSRDELAKVLQGLP